MLCRHNLALSHSNEWLRTTRQPFTALFPGPPGWAGARRELLDFMVQGKINRGRNTDHSAGRHSIRTNQCPPPPSPPYFLRAGCPSCRPTNSVKALLASYCKYITSTTVMWYSVPFAAVCSSWLEKSGNLCHLESGLPVSRVTTNLENSEKSGNWKMAREMGSQFNADLTVVTLCCGDWCYLLR